MPEEKKEMETMADRLKEEPKKEEKPVSEEVKAEVQPSSEKPSNEGKHRKNKRKKAKADRPVRSVGNWFAFGLARLYAFFLIFVGLCRDGSKDAVMGGADNAIYQFALGLGRKPRVPGLSARVVLVLVACYIALLVFALGYEYQYRKRKNKNPWGVNAFSIYFLSVFICAFLSIGVGILIQTPITTSNIRGLLTYIGNCRAVSLRIYAFLALFIGAILISVFTLYKLVTRKKNEDVDEDNSVKDNDITSDRPEAADAEGNVTSAGDISAAFGGNGSGSTSLEEATIKEREQVFPGLSSLDKVYNGVKSKDNSIIDNLTLPDLITQFRNYLAKVEKLYYSADDLRTFVAGRTVSHFSILEGRSGTGKSSLPRFFCKFVNGEVVFLPVQATWRDKTSLLGYFNDFTKTYNETDALLKLYEANYNPDKIYRFVLDERNISRVEYYFADFLSTLEYPEDQWKIRVYQLPYGFIPPRLLGEGKLKISPNSYFVGTANQDESTFAIADKVYDRSVTMDFNDRNEPFVVEEDAKSIHLTNTQLTTLLEEAKKNQDNQLTKADRKKFDAVANYIAENFSVAYGNRILNQIENFVPAFVGCGGKKEDALDYILSEKIVRKLQGRFEDYVRPCLEEVDKMLTSLYGAKEFPRTRKRIKERIKKL